MMSKRKIDSEPQEQQQDVKSYKRGRLEEDSLVEASESNDKPGIPNQLGGAALRFKARAALRALQARFDQVVLENETLQANQIEPPPSNQLQRERIILRENENLKYEINGLKTELALMR